MIFWFPSEAGRPVYHLGTDPEPTPFLRRTLASWTFRRTGRHRGVGQGKSAPESVGITMEATKRT